VAQALSRLPAKVAALVTPETLLRWYWRRMAKHVRRKPASLISRPSTRRRGGEIGDCQRTG
jgi:hypothetical protein